MAFRGRATKMTIEAAEQLLDYMSTHPDTTIIYCASDIILNLHSDASYLSKLWPRSGASGHFFLGWLPNHDEPIKFNSQNFSLWSILEFVASSVAEAELDALYVNMKEIQIMCLTLALEHPQPTTTIYCDNPTTVGIVKETLKQQRSWSIKMKYCYVVDQVKNGIIKVCYHPRAENLGDYSNKHFPAPIPSTQDPFT